MLIMNKYLKKLRWPSFRFCLIQLYFMKISSLAELGVLGLKVGRGTTYNYF